MQLATHVSCVCSTFPGGDDCGEPLCNTLSVTVSGHVYYTTAYTQRNAGTPDNIQDVDCKDWAALDACVGGVVPRVGAPNGAAKEAPQSAKASIASASEAASADYSYAPSNWYQGLYEEGTVCHTRRAARGSARAVCVHHNRLTAALARAARP